jgi:hypothetical protein
MTKSAISPAQKILAAFNDRHELCGPFDDNWQELCLAAAFREFAHEVVPEPPMLVEGGRTYEEAWTATVQEDIRTKLLAIAAELENPQP